MISAAKHRVFLKFSKLPAGFYNQPVDAFPIRCQDIGEHLKSMPEGLHTQLYKDFTESGVEVSGGEAQYYAEEAARALL